MSSLRMNRKPIGMAAVLVMSALFCGCAFEDKYVRIDNSHTTEGSDGVINLDGAGGLPVKYELECVNASGQTSTCTFGAEEELEEGAYVVLHTQGLRGVVSYEFAQLQDLPEKVQDYFHEQQITDDE